MFVIQVGSNAYDTARSGTDTAELNHRIGPEEMAVNGVLVGEHLLGHDLADDDHHLTVLAVAVVEIASGDKRYTEGREETRRDRTELSARVLFARLSNVAVGRELKSWSEIACVAPGDHGTERDTIYAREGADLSDRLLVEVNHLLGRLAITHYRHIHSEHPPDIHAGLCRLQHEQRLEEHARSGEQYKRRSDLSDRKNTETAAGAPRDPEIAGREVETLGPIDNGRRGT